MRAALNGHSWTGKNFLQPRSQGFFPHNLKFSTGKSPENEVETINLTNQNTRQTFMWADQISWQAQGVDAKLRYCRYQAGRLDCSRKVTWFQLTNLSSVKVNNSCRKQIKETKKAVYVALQNLFLLLQRIHNIWFEFGSLLSSTTWFQTSSYCRCKVEFTSINWVRRDSSNTHFKNSFSNAKQNKLNHLKSVEIKEKAFKKTF